MIDAVAQYIKSKPTSIQIAKDGKWEDAWIVDVTKVEPSLSDIKYYLSGSVYKEISVEAVFEEAGDGDYILGLTFNNHLHVKTAESFLQMFISACLHFNTFHLFIDVLNRQVIGQNVLLTGDPDLIRIGIVNHWFSVGPCLVWQKGWSKEMSKAKLEERLQTKPEVIETKLNYQGMSFIFNVSGITPGLCHWMKSPCSRKGNGIWRLDRTMILDYLHSWQSFTTS